MKPKSPRNDAPPPANENRIAAALRDNLRKRKAQKEARENKSAKAN